MVLLAGEVGPQIGAGTTGGEREAEDENAGTFSRLFFSSYFFSSGFWLLVYILKTTVDLCASPNSPFTSLYIGFFKR